LVVPKEVEHVVALRKRLRKVLAFNQSQICEDGSPIWTYVLADAPDERLVEAEVPEFGSGQMLLRTVYLSLDLYVRGRMKAKKIGRLKSRKTTPYTFAS
jgi:hypothetical protein